MLPRDAWLLEKLDRMKARRRAAALDRAIEPEKKERTDLNSHSGLPLRIEFKEVVE